MVKYMGKYPYPLTSLGLKTVSAVLAQGMEEEVMLRKQTNNVRFFPNNQRTGECNVTDYHFV